MQFTQAHFEQQWSSDRLGRGCYGTVYALKGNEDYVVKLARNDGTRTYLEWCKHRQSIGRGMRGMPRVRWIVGTDEGYAVCMPRLPHKPGDEGLEMGWARYGLPGGAYYPANHTHTPAYLRKLVEAMQDEAGIHGNDMHYQNFMVDHDGTIVLNDPDSGSYYPPSETPYGRAKHGPVHEVEGPMAQMHLI